MEIGVGGHLSGDIRQHRLALVEIDDGGKLVQQRIEAFTGCADDRADRIAQEIQQEEIGIAEPGQPEQGQMRRAIDRPCLHERRQIELDDFGIDPDLGQLLLHQFGHRHGHGQHRQYHQGRFQTAGISGFGQ